MADKMLTECVWSVYTAWSCFWGSSESWFVSDTIALASSGRIIPISSLPPSRQLPISLDRRTQLPSISWALEVRSISRLTVLNRTSLLASTKNLHVARNRSCSFKDEGVHEYYLYWGKSPFKPNVHDLQYNSRNVCFLLISQKKSSKKLRLSKKEEQAPFHIKGIHAPVMGEGGLTWPPLAWGCLCSCLFFLKTS